ncbi:putative RNA recognition motif containing protein [Klebsormidium nitens]|uniref:Putative RNA recognition motif containing protein n=1 Tax=Klebsormidium nitens TaxID=105231 RepID=A0A0U9HK97_KLENI|nr:putative RNA recognition motif containing protein [Klebsormidium nitens]|eukprot:GAQ84002.1 putative RNA recognition motif containing protein [Klebsormidium nitens]
MAQDERRGSDSRVSESERRRERKRKSGWDDPAPQDPPKDARTSQRPKTVDDELEEGVRQAQLIAKQRAAQATAAAKATAAQAPPKDACRIYVGSIYYELNESDIILAFSAFGSIHKIDMPRDAATAKHKGFCFIEFHSSEAAENALNTMNEFVLAGRKLKVGRPHNIAGMPGGIVVSTTPPTPQAQAAFKQAQQQAQAISAQLSLRQQQQAQLLIAQQQQALENPHLVAQGLLPPPNPAAIQALLNPSRPDARIYVGSIYYEISEEDIKAVFQAFGQVKSCNLIPNPETGKHKGYGFIEFEQPEAAKAAIDSMNGFDLGGRQLKVGWAAANAGLPTPPPLPNPNLPNMPFGMPPMPAVLPPVTFSPNPFQPPFQPTLAPPPMPIAPPVVPGLKPTRCVLLKNMVGPEEVDADLEGEVTEECSKHGEVERVVIYQEQASARKDDIQVKIFVLFRTVSEAQRAHRSLDKRWFGGRQIEANFYDEARFKRQDLSG